MDRKGLAIKSSFIGLFSKLIIAVLGFACRKVFLECLGAELLGVSGTLVQVLETLSLTELGFQTTIIFQLYRPIAENDQRAISGIMNLIKRIYSVIGLIIAVLGIALLPFLRFIITRVDVEFTLVYAVYLVMLAGTVASYFLSYNRAFLQADQKMYVVNLIDCILQIVAASAKIISLIVFKSFIIYASIGVLCTFGGNLLSYAYYKKKYPYIRKDIPPDSELKKKLIVDTRDVFVGRIAGYVYSSTDNLVISSLVGTVWVGLVGNYTTIINAIKMVVFGLTAPIQPMMGNYAVEKSVDETERIMNNYGFVRYALALFLLVPTIVLSDMFVALLYGKEYVLNPAISLLLVADLLVICLQGAVGEMIDALGFFKQERNMYIMYAIMNLGLSIAGAVLWGVIPVFAATVLSQTVSWIWRSIIAYKYYYKSMNRFLRYWKVQGGYLLFFAIVTTLIMIGRNMIAVSQSVFMFVILGLLIELVVGSLFFVVYRKHEGFVFLRHMLQRMIGR